MCVKIAEHKLANQFLETDQEVQQRNVWTASGTLRPKIIVEA